MSVSHINLVSYIARYSAISLFLDIAPDLRCLRPANCTKRRRRQRWRRRHSAARSSTPTPNPLPQEPPAPGVIYRESFGAADLYLADRRQRRHESGLYPHDHSGFLDRIPRQQRHAVDNTRRQPNLEILRLLPRSTRMRCSRSIQVTYGNGCVASEWFDPVTTYPSGTHAGAAAHRPL